MSPGPLAEFFDPDTVWAPFGAFSMAAAAGPEDRVVHLKGQVALDPDGEVIGDGDMARQVTQTLDNIRAVLTALGGEMADIIALTQHVTDIEAFMACGAVRSRYFVAPYPATTTVEVSRLYDPRLMVEITAVAAIPALRFKSPQPGA